MGEAIKFWGRPMSIAEKIASWEAQQKKGHSITVLKRLDQGHIHPLQEHLETNMSQPRIEPGSQASTLAKSYSNIFCYCYSEPLQYICVVQNLWSNDSCINEIKSQPANEQKCKEVIVHCQLKSFSTDFKFNSHAIICRVLICLLRISGIKLCVESNVKCNNHI